MVNQCLEFASLPASPCLSVCLSVCLSTCLPVNLPDNLSESVCMPTFQPLCLHAAYQSVYRHARLSASPPVSLSSCQPISQSAYQPVSLSSLPHLASFLEEHVMLMFALLKVVLETGSDCLPSHQICYCSKALHNRAPVVTQNRHGGKFSNFSF